MKFSKRVTTDILVKANTNSEWDNCEFAIIHLTEAWKNKQAKRLAFVKPFMGDYHFASMNFYDTAVDFFGNNEKYQPSIDKMISEKSWAFVELEEGEPVTLKIPENSLTCYRLVLHANGTAFYSAYGKHTSEEFWTEEFDLYEICSLFTEEDGLEKYCQERFQHLSNAQLVARVNSLPDFGWDDEGVELQRRKWISNGAFDYEFRGNIMVILKDEKPCR